MQVNTPNPPPVNAVVAPKDDYTVDIGAGEETAPAEETPPAKLAAESEAEENEVENETEETETESGTESEETREASEATETKGKKKGGFQRRLDKLTKRAADAQRETDYWKAEALKGKSAPGEQTKVETKAAVETSSDAPKADDFDLPSDYLKAVAKWEVKQEIAAEKAQVRIAEAKVEHQKMLKSHNDRYNAFAKATPDFKEVMQDIADVQLKMHMSSAIVESEFGPQLMYEFAKNPEELDRLNSLTPAAAARAIGRMEAKFEAASSGTKNETSPAKTETKKVSSAPKPIEPLNSKVSRTKTTRDEIPYDEWKKIREAELKGG